MISYLTFFNVLVLLEFDKSKRPEYTTSKIIVKFLVSSLSSSSGDMPFYLT